MKLMKVGLVMAVAMEAIQLTGKKPKKTPEQNAIKLEAIKLTGKEFGTVKMGRPPLTKEERDARRRARWKRNNEKYKVFPCCRHVMISEPT